MVNARKKGNRGELEWIRFVVRHLGGEGRRTPNSGGLSVKSDVRFYRNVLEGTHHEVKRQERWCLPAWIAQAERDAGSRIWFLPFRRNNGRWYVAMDAEDMMVFLARLQEAEDARSGD